MEKRVKKGLFIIFFEYKVYFTCKKQKMRLRLGVNAFMFWVLKLKILKILAYLALLVLFVGLDK